MTLTHRLKISGNILDLNKLIDLPIYHRDPFDRLIIAQALAEGIPVISSDAAFSPYAVKLIW
jgi:PIN domain nuclease of toxin-antitoxin system